MPRVWSVAWFDQPLSNIHWTPTRQTVQHQLPLMVPLTVCCCCRCPAYLGRTRLTLLTATSAKMRQQRDRQQAQAAEGQAAEAGRAATPLSRERRCSSGHKVCCVLHLRTAGNAPSPRAVYMNAFKHTMPLPVTGDGGRISQPEIVPLQGNQAVWCAKVHYGALRCTTVVV
jgi:hypothetical protein